ncbi:MAG TPA: DUF5668 domain-containing protein [Candidatus Saccharimonadales bacterium]|jgi:hypothetical protein|nr:DUF5668 domain-containing protein [Candidatus Saccharimonadales bacterium]
MTTAQASITPQLTRRGPSLAWPLILITLGVVFLLANAGYITGDLWGRLAQIWPMALVLIGVDLLVRPRSVPAALVAEVALIAAAVVYAIAAPAVFPATANINASVARNGASQLDLNLSYGAGSLTLAGGATDLVTVLSTRQDVQVSNPVTGAALAAVTVRPVNEPFQFGGDRRWDVRVPSDLPTALTISLGAGDFKLDLGSVPVTRATVTVGASSLTLTAPHPKADVPIRISGGASSMTINIPSGVEYRVSMDGGLNSITGPTQSAGYATAADRVTISVSAGASSVTVH